MPVAETFTFTDDTGASLGDIARLDTLVTVVDGSSFLDELYAADELRGRGWEATETDERTVAQLFCDQLEFANVIVMNKMDLMDGPSKARLKAVLRRFNPEAQLIEATYSQVDPARVLGTRLFELSKAEQHPEWLKEARVGEHVPESIEFGISSFTFRSGRPFHPTRLRELAAAMETRAELVPGAAAAAAAAAVATATATATATTDTDDTATTATTATTTTTTTTLSAGQKAALRVVRAKGIVWLASSAGHGQQGVASLAGRHFTISPGAPWWASHDKSLWPDGLADAIAPLWHEPWGDRQNELVVIGQEMDHGAVRAALEACVLTDDEMEAGLEACAVRGGAAGAAECWEAELGHNPWKADWERQLEIAAVQKADLEAHNAAVAAAVAEEEQEVTAEPGAGEGE